MTPYSELKKGTFLIASPDIDDGIFFRSVILLCDHSPVGSFGLIVNKPLDIELPEDLSEFQELTSQNIGMRASGPNQPNQMMLLHPYKIKNEDNLEICENIYLGGNLEFLNDSEFYVEKAKSI